MCLVPIELSRRPIAAAVLAEITRSLLEASTLCAISTVGASGRAHVNTAYFATTAQLDLVWLSEPSARHSKNLSIRESAAIAVFDSHQIWGVADRGIQLFGSAHAATGPENDLCRAAYARRFTRFDNSEFGAYRFYRFRPRRLKLFDESALGSGVFVTATVRRDGGLNWAKTELYTSN
jgi:uncharacterized protein YhbP (UPF0306 family)